MKQNKAERERHRKERGKAELNRMINRYEIECGECITYMATDEDLEYFEKLRKKNKENFKKSKWLGDAND